MSDYQKVIISFGLKTRYHSEPMELDVQTQMLILTTLPLNEHGHYYMNVS